MQYPVYADMRGSWRSRVNLVLYANLVFLLLNLCSFYLQHKRVWATLDLAKTFQVAPNKLLYHSTRVMGVDHRKPRDLRWRRVNGTSRQPQSWRKTGILHEMHLFNVSILSAVGRNSTPTSGWDKIILNGWEGRTHANDTYNCCLQFSDGKMFQVRVFLKNHWLKCKWVHYTAVQFTCPNLRNNSGVIPTGVALTPQRVSCSDKQNDMMSITLVRRQPQGSVALCAKIAYGLISPYRLLEWYEVQKAMGVSKVLTFTYNLTGNAMAVLKHYQQEGLVEVRRFDYPHKDRLPRFVGEKNQHAFNDEQVVAFDCSERLAGYHFVGILDHDEFVVPAPPGIVKWKNLFNILLRRKPDSSGFWFRTELFISNWQQQPNDTRQMSVANYSLRTRPMWDRSKSIFIPDRVEPGSVWTHNYTDKNGFQKYMVSSGLATLKHFRSCRKQWVEKNTCFRLRQYSDRRLTQYVGGLRGEVSKRMEDLLGQHGNSTS